jgi:hypothetical protein
MKPHRRTPSRRRKTNRFSHAYIRASSKAYTGAALRDFTLRSHAGVAPTRQILKITALSHTLLSVPLNFGPSRDPTQEPGIAIA